MKYCKKCESNKPLEDFNFKNKAQNLKKSICKVCEKTYNADRYKSEKAHIQKQHQDWKQANKERYLQYQKQYNNHRKNK
jgi:hypothetical protein